jgi:hypothetical protein
MIDELTNYAFNAGRYARMLEEYNAQAEALLNEREGKETVAPGTSSVLETESDNDVRSEISGMLRDVRTSPGPLTQTPDDREQGTVF